MHQAPLSCVVHLLPCCMHRRFTLRMLVSPTPCYTLTHITIITDPCAIVHHDVCRSTSCYTLTHILAH